MAPTAKRHERTPGVWTMVDSTGRDYGIVRIVRGQGDAIVYVSELRGQKLGGRNISLRGGRREGPRRLRAIVQPHAGPPTVVQTTHLSLGADATGGPGYGADMTSHWQDSRDKL